MKPIITKYNNENIHSKSYLNNKKHYHNENGPALIFYYENGKIKEEYYYINGAYHRIDGPAVIHYNKSGKIRLEEFYLYGKNFNSLEELQLYVKTIILL